MTGVVAACRAGLRGLHVWEATFGYLYPQPTWPKGGRKKKRGVALAGNRTRVNCLEGSYAHHYTTNAGDSTPCWDTIYKHLWRIFGINISDL